MINFSDPTVLECNGNYLLIMEVMDTTGWMLETNATVVESDIVSNYVLHLWYDGTVVIVDTDRSNIIGSPDSDLRRIREWCEVNGWQMPSISNDLIDNQQEFNFWMRMYQSGIIYNEKLQKQDEEEIRRLSVSPHNEESE